MEKGQVETSEIPSHPSAKIVNRKQYGIPGETEKASATTEDPIEQYRKGDPCYVSI